MISQEKIKEINSLRVERAECVTAKKDLEINKESYIEEMGQDAYDNELEDYEQNIAGIDNQIENIFKAK